LYLFFNRNMRKYAQFGYKGTTKNAYMQEIAYFS
jgi:hypothetical protein